MIADLNAILERFKKPSLILLVFFTGGLFAQNSNENIKQSDQYVFEGDNLVKKNFPSAEKKYRTAISEAPSNKKAAYNLGKAYYDRGLFDEALKHFKEASKSESKEEKHRSFHNIGNIMMKKEACAKAVEAYKDALRNKPSADDTRYNLALAQECAKEENGGGGNDKKEQRDENKKKKNQKKQDNNKNQNNKDNGKKEKKQKGMNNSPKKETKKGNNGKPEPRLQGKLSPQQIKSLLKAMDNEENKVQKKIKASKSKGLIIETEKDW